MSQPIVVEDIAVCLVCNDWLTAEDLDDPSLELCNDCVAKKDEAQK